MNPAQPELHSNSPVRSPSHRWEVADAPVRIRVGSEVIERLRAAVADAFGSTEKKEIGGILLGRKILDGGTPIVEVLDFEAVPCRRHAPYAPSWAERRAFGERCAAWRQASAGFSAVGYFRSQNGGAGTLDESDVGLMRRYFPSATDVCLLLRPLDLRSSAGTWYWRGAGGQFETRAGALGFPVDSSRLPSVVHSVAPPARPSAAVLPGGQAPGGAPRREPSYAWVLIPVLAAVLLGAGVFAIQRLRGSATAIPEAMQVTKDGDDFRVVWNRNAPLFNSARAAVLSVLDGTYTKDVALDLRLESGMLLYSPTTADIEFRLHVFGNTERTQAVRVLGNRAMTVSVPEPSPAVPAQPAPAARSEERRAPLRQSARFLPPPTAAQPAAAQQALTEPPRLGSEPQAEVPGVLSARQALPSPPPAPASPPPAAASKAASVSPVAASKPEPTPPVAASKPPTDSPSLVAPKVTSAPARAAAVEAPARPTRRITPAVPSSIRSMLARDVSVQVTVRVDTTGTVTSASVAKLVGAPQNHILGRLATEAARQWKFAPATFDGHPVPSEVMLEFRFSRN